MFDKELIWKEIKSHRLEKDINRNEEMRAHTSWKIGGSADFFCIPSDQYRLIKILLFAKNYELPVYIMGNGTNLWVPDEGIRGLVIKVAHTIDKVEYSGKIIKAGAGILLPALVRNAVKNELGGLEFAAHIPGTLGGAILNNASFGKDSMAGIVDSITLFDYKNGLIKKLIREQFSFFYRGVDLGMKEFVILEVSLSLSPQEEETSLLKIKQFYEQRRAGQPINLLTAGCIFKNPAEKSAGYLIEQSGAKGLTVGGAQVSHKHANFIINLGSATASDILQLMEKIENMVEKTFGIKLEREIDFIGEIPGS